MKQNWIETLFATLIALTLVAIAGTPINAQTTKIGSFHKPSIVVAYYRSPQWAEILNAKVADLKRAKEANDAKKADELEKWGSGHQELAHRQLAGEAPIDNILEVLKPAFAEIAKKAGVSAVVAADALPAGAQSVDVTDLLLDWLKADARTRAIVKDLRNRQEPLTHLH